MLYRQRLMASTGKPHGLIGFIRPYKAPTPPQDAPTKAKRGYVGWMVVQNTVAEEPDKTAIAIAKEYDFKVPSVRAAAKKLGITLPRQNWGGRRHPCNQHAKRAINEQARANP